MLLSQLFILLLSVLLIIDQVIISAATNIHENVAILCGASGNSPAPDGRVWVGDATLSSSLLQLRGKSMKSRVPQQAGLSNSVPYKSARTSRHEFTYQFSVKPGQKFIRLHFKPASYKGFKKSKAIFTVKTGQHTLLSDFIPTLAVGMSYFKKEFCINVQESETLSITFVPSRTSFLEDTYAFVNAIEIVSMPAGLYFTPDGDQGVPVVGRKHRLDYIDNNTALETIQRINVGGNSISSLEDATMFRDWEDETNYLIQVGSTSIKRAAAIRYTSSATHIAPKEVYQTARSVGAHCHSNVCNLTWNIPLDLGFRYLVRLHFCEIGPAMTNEGESNFIIVINNQKAEDEADVIKWSGSHGTSIYRDYVAIMEGDRREGKHNLSIVLQPTFATISNHSNAILNGIEVFKISNPDNNLGTASPVHTATSSTPEKSLLFATKNKIATVLTFIITLINIAVFYVSCNPEMNSGKTNNRLPLGEHQCRRFSLDEMVRSTNNFDPQLVIGRGGYGTVYKGDIDAGKTTVAVKQLKPGSSQGENEFWTEIKMLSTHRHENLLSLIGYCNEGDEMLLVYDYMPRGSLADHLFKMDRSGHGNYSLLWEQRLKIAIGAARGLNFLHTSQNKVIHRDVKSSNILLDENWVSKISDFGLSKMGPGNESATHVSTQVKGTFGYLDPEYFLTNRLTWKTDVYAFGVVLFEVLSGRPAVDMRLPEEQHGLVAWAKQCIKEGEIDKLIDQNLSGSISSACLKAFIGISAKCFDSHPHERPVMSEVVKSLELALVFQKNAGVGIISSDDTSTSQSKVEEERATIKEDCNGIDRAEKTAISRNKVKFEDKSIFIASPRWWDIRGLFRKAPPKPWNPNSQISPHPNLRIFSFAELKAATRKFSNDTLLGDGGFGNVYKGWLDESSSSKSGRTAIAIKKMNSESLLGFEEWQSKLSILGRLSHPNLTKLLGYCQEDKELLLVFEFMQKGSLANHLFGRRSAALSLPWNVRLKIEIGAARGLAFLHSSEKQVICRDFKASNILLDGSYNAKISISGLVKQVPSVSQSHVSTRLMGTYGYAAPEYIATGHLYVKSDVYGFGVFLVEMLTGLRAIDVNRPSNQHNLVEWIKPHLSDKRKLKDKMDSRLGGKYPSIDAVQIAQLALSCLGKDPKSRPSMKEVVEKLEQIEATNERPKEHRISSKHQTAERYGQQPLHNPSPLNPRNQTYPVPRRSAE